MTTVTAALPPGTSVDSLRVDRVIGAGAFSITYLVTDPVLNQSYALKEFRPKALVERAADGRLTPMNEEASRAFAAGLQRFIEEGRMLASLEHPNVVKVVRCLEANGTAYLQMPWYRGEALHKLLQRSGTLSADETLALAGPLLDALEYLQRRGVIHQDIKPSNIYITEQGVPILLDFGAARSDSSGSGQGSEGYAAPEQADGGEFGPWTDAYGLAATLYRCITGQIPPAASRRRRATAAGDADPLTPLRERTTGADWAAIAGAVDQGLMMDPTARPRSTAKWRKSFQPAGDARQVGRAPIPSGYETEGREWLPLILLGVFGVILLAAVVYLFTGDSPEHRDGEADPSAQAPGPVVGPDGTLPETPEERARWEAALDADTAYGYRRFMEDYPNSIHNDQALVHLERLDHQAWGYARETGTKAALETYLENFPGGHHQVEAEILLHEYQLAEEAAERERLELERQDEAAWKEAAARRTIAAVDGYLAAWPAGLYADEARALRRQIDSEQNDHKAFDAARKLNTLDAYESYVAAFPQGRNVAEALEAIDQLTLRPGKGFRDCAECPSMVVVPAGSFWQGSEESSPDALKMETPRRMVTIARPFAVSVFEITMAQWDRCVAAGACSNRPPDNGWGRDSRPVIMVSWNDAQEYTSWLSQQTGQSYSLPSESQWEYVARAGEESDWLGGDPDGICEFGNIAGSESGFRWQHEQCADSAALETLPVGSFKANAFGVHDVIGNVAEWTLDCMNLSYLDAPADGSAWGRGICSSRMTRGGSWFTGTREVRLPARFNLKNGDRNDFTGFRVVRAVEEQ